MSETARWSGPAPAHQQRSQQVDGKSDGANLADILERVLDKGIVIAGDIQVNLLDIELLTIKIRLVVASVERAKEMGIDWWERDPTLSAGRRELEDENKELRARIEALERNGQRGDRALSTATDDDEPYDDVADGGVDGTDDGPGEPVDELDEDVHPDDVDDPDDGLDEDVHPEDVHPEDDRGPDDRGPDDRGPDGRDDAEPDEHDGPAGGERPTRGNGRAGRAGRARSDRARAADGPDGNGSGRAGRGRSSGSRSRDDEPARRTRGSGRSDGDEREMPVRRKAGSRRPPREE